MKLGEFLTNVPPATGSGKKEQVSFTLIARSTKDASQVETTGYACFSLVSDKDCEEAEVDALKSLRDLSKELGIVPSSTLASRERAELLLRALRDYDDPRSRFAGTAEEIQRHVPRADMERVEREYREWVERYYPSKITKADRAELKHEAVGK